MCRFQAEIKSLILIVCILFAYPHSFLLAQSENIVSLQEISEVGCANFVLHTRFNNPVIEK